MIDIFCPKCGELILDQAACPACAWRRPAVGAAVGAELWRADLGTRLVKPYCYPVIAAGLYCLGTEDGTLLALDVDQGTVAWERPLGNGGMAHAMATDGARLFVGCEDLRPIPVLGRSLLALDARTGQELWQHPTQAHSLSAPTVALGSVYVSATDGRLHAVDADTGRGHWAVEHPVWGPAAPAVGEGVICAGGRGGTLVGYATADGQELWRFSAQGWFATPPCIEAGCVYALCWDDRLYALDAHTGMQLWEYKGERGKGLTSPPGVTRGQVYAGTRVYRQGGEGAAPGYAVVALQAEDGVEAWRYHVDRHIWAPLTVSGDVLYAGSEDGTLYAVNATNGQELWQARGTGRMVAQPQVAGDAVISAGRDGMVYAFRWRARAEESLLDPGTHERRGEYEMAAIARALRGELQDAALLYERELGKLREAALLYGRAGVPAKAAHLWDSLGDAARARDLYEQAGDKVGLAGLLCRTGEPLEAARLLEETGKLEEAAALYAEAGDRPKAAELYWRLGQHAKALVLWVSLGHWERQVEALVDDGKTEEAALVLEEHGHLERAADLFEQSGQLVKALDLRVSLGHWEQAAELAVKVSDDERVGLACERLGKPLAAAEAYVRAAQGLQTSGEAAQERLAALYERAATLYEQLFEEEHALACRGHVRRCRCLPEVQVRIQAREVFVEHQWNVLDLEVENAGYGIARQIDISLGGRFETLHAASVAGLPAQRSRNLEVSARPLSGEVGAAVPLDVAVTYQDLNGRLYQVTQSTLVQVVQSGILPGIMTPLQIHIQGDMLAPGAKKVEGSEVHPGGQFGDRVEIRRGEGGASITLQDGAMGSRVQIRRPGVSVRRCPNPQCNVPIDDPRARFCHDCGAPLEGEDRQVMQEKQA